MASRAILHVDMDAFYASVEALDDPSLRGKPLIVGGTGPRGVVAAASYEVRKFGVHSAMPMREALRRCPHAICVRPRFERYREVSRVVFDIFHAFTPIVEGLSLDEAFLDVTQSLRAFGPADAIAAQIKQRIREQTGLTASVGVAPNKLVAKIASDLRKPDGLVVVPAEAVTELLDPLSVRKLFGIGNKTALQLERIGIRTLKELRAAPDALLRPIFGRYVALMKARAAGIDDRPVIAEWDEKQISSEETFDTDLTDVRTLHDQLARLADRTASRLRAQGWLAGLVVVKIRRNDFKTYTRQARLQPATQQTRPILSAAGRLLNEWHQEQPHAAVRLLGVAARDLSAVPQLELFASPEQERERELDATIDQIRAKFGHGALYRAAALRRAK
ncbi:MAG: DNA polymerase IV [Gammaproteobacteria bacterium]|nr:DNA polymerase IV [Gammaproteobacteria bacterium]